MTHRHTHSFPNIRFSCRLLPSTSGRVECSWGSVYLPVGKEASMTKDCPREGWPSSSVFSSQLSLTNFTNGTTASEIMNWYNFCVSQALGCCKVYDERRWWDAKGSEGLWPMGTVGLFVPAVLRAGYTTRKWWLVVLVGAAQHGKIQIGPISKVWICNGWWIITRT